MWWPRSLFCGQRLVAVFSLSLALGLMAGRVSAAEDTRQLQLEVILNGSDTHLIGSFQQLGGRQMAARRAELIEIGLNPRGYASPDKLIVLDDLTGLSYKYDEAAQKIFIKAPDNLLVRKQYDGSHHPHDMHVAKTDYGAVLNYNLLTGAASHPNAQLFAFDGASATLDARAFSPFGTVGQSAILRTTNSQFDVLRLDSTFTYSDPATLIKYRAGDIITGSLAWTRPIRIGGLQAQRSFGLRPDLVTLPLPAAQGSAAVPSTADVYINNIKTFSQNISSGPYRLTNLPVTTGSGTVRVVIRDASGHETVSTLPFYTSPNLLAPGLLDFSVEVGLPRFAYGTPSDTYVTEPVGSASLRYGVFDWLTLAGHVELGAGLLNGSAGIIARTGSFGVASGAISASRFAGASGFQSYLSYETQFLGINLRASSQMTFGYYDDLASATARLAANTLTDPFGIQSWNNISASIAAIAPSFLISARPPKAFNSISLGIPLPLDRATLSANYIQSIDGYGVHSNIISATLSLGLPYETSLFATGFVDPGDNKNQGFLVGLSMPLGGSVTADTSISGGTGGTTINVDAAKPLDQKPGSFGWRIRDSEGNAPQRSAAVSYRSDYARADAGVTQDRNGAIATAELDGAVVTMGGGVFFANRIDDAFAVVETGVPGVEVFSENRPVGTTDSHGRLLVANLRSYQKNKLSIDVRKLPVDAGISKTNSIVVPADRAGVQVNFAVQTDARPAIVVLQAPDGKPIPAGSHGQLEGGEDFVVGYDGEAYIKGLGPENKVHISTVDRECNAAFAYSPHPNEQVIISPVVCR